MRADPDSPVWLHENTMTAPAKDWVRQDMEAGIHSHAEDEVILVTSGQMRLGAKLYPAGTVLAIAAETLYGFTVGPEGLSFVNFRAGRPTDIRFKNGATIDEVGYWRDRVPQPQHLSPGG